MGIHDDGVVATHLLGKDTFGEQVEHITLNGTLHRSGTKLGIEPCLGYHCHSLIGDTERQSLLLEHP